MDLVGIALSVSLSLSGGQFTGDYTVNVSPTILVEVPTRYLRASAITLPGLILVDPLMVPSVGRGSIRRPNVLRHEMLHIRQMEALGPSFWVSYVLTAGSAFEPYGRASLLPAQSWGYEEVGDFSKMWKPPSNMAGSYPIFRLNRRSEEFKFQFLPGYPELISLRN